jgi:hypothetical protein
MKPNRALPAIFFAGLSFALYAVNAPPPLPVAKKHYRSGEVARGAGAAKLIAKAAPLAPPHTNSITWLYPANLNPSNFWWNVEASTDLTNWVVVITNASGTCEVTVNRNEALRIYRLSGRFSP